MARPSALAVPTRRNRALWQIDSEEAVSVPLQGAAIDTLLMTTEACHTMTTIGLTGDRTEVDTAVEAAAVDIRTTIGEAEIEEVVATAGATEVAVGRLTKEEEAIAQTIGTIAEIIEEGQEEIITTTEATKGFVETETFK